MGVEGVKGGFLRTQTVQQSSLRTFAGTHKSNASLSPNLLKVSFKEDTTKDGKQALPFVLDH